MRSNRKVMEVLEVFFLFVCFFKKKKKFFSFVANYSYITLGEKADAYSCVKVVVRAYGSPCCLLFSSMKQEISSSIRSGGGEQVWKFEEKKNENLLRSWNLERNGLGKYDDCQWHKGHLDESGGWGVGASQPLWPKY